MEHSRISLKAARVNANLSQKEAAIKLGVNRATLHNYEDGKTVPGWDVVKRIELVYNFPTDQIFFPSSTLKANKPTKTA